MGRLKIPTNAAMLKQLTPLRPVTRNATRWYSTFEMLKRYESIKSVLSDPGFEIDKRLIDALPTRGENTKISELQPSLQKLYSVTLALEREKTTLSDVRCLFDDVIANFPITAKYLSPDAEIIQDKVFERALVKLQRSKSAELTLKEAESVSKLKQPDQVEPTSQSDDGELSFADSALKRMKMELSTSEVKYLPTNFLLPTTNLVERFFSVASHALNDKRAAISPARLETQLFLKMNKRFWDKETVSRVISIHNQQ